jgi:hypothetical protein
MSTVNTVTAPVILSVTCIVLTVPDSVIKIIELADSIGTPSIELSVNGVAANNEVNFLEYMAFSKFLANFSAGVSTGALNGFCALAKLSSPGALFGLPPKNDGLMKLKFKFSA